MDVSIRPGRPDDLDQIAAFTEHTFSWGDYVADHFLAWLDDASSLTMVAVDSAGTVVGMGRTVLLSPTEAWLHAARVHPDHRRSGVGGMLNRHGCDWARDRGARIARLLIEEHNLAAQRQVDKLGYRPVAGWASAVRRLGAGSPDPATNGGRRVPGEERLTPAPRAEAEPAWIAWAGSELAAAGRQLFPLGWHFRQMTIDDVVEAARGRRLHQAPSGWVITGLEEEALSVPWLVTTDRDARRLLRAVQDLAIEATAGEVRLMVPRAAWLVEALADAGYEMAPNTVWGRLLEGEPSGGVRAS